MYELNKLGIFSPSQAQRGQLVPKNQWEMVGGIEAGKQAYVYRDDHGIEILSITLAANHAVVDPSVFQTIFPVFIKANSDGSVRSVAIAFDQSLDYPEPDNV
jgi:hypothetical protein